MLYIIFLICLIYMCIRLFFIDYIVYFYIKQHINEVEHKATVIESEGRFDTYRCKNYSILMKNQETCGVFTVKWNCVLNEKNSRLSKKLTQLIVNQNLTK